MRVGLLLACCFLVSIRRKTDEFYFSFFEISLTKGFFPRVIWRNFWMRSFSSGVYPIGSPLQFLLCYFIASYGFSFILNKGNALKCQNEKNFSSGY